VLDVDSDKPDDFDAVDEQALEQVMRAIEKLL
jgi:putative methionine-R-sulfoxide reductase with GAF domain